MRADRRVPGQLCGLRGFLTRYLDGKSWMHIYQIPSDPLRFVAAVGERVLTPPNRFCHDFASIPSVAWQLVGPPTGHGPGTNYGPAAIIHDWMYEHQKWDNGDPLTRQQADAIMWECCMDLGVDEWRCEVIYAALRIGGAFHWNAHAKGRIPCPKYGSG